MPNIANKIKSTECEDSVAAQKIVDALIKCAKALVESVLTRPKCGCDKILCGTCRRDTLEIKTAEELKGLLVNLEEPS